MKEVKRANEKLKIENEAKKGRENKKNLRNEEKLNKINYCARPSFVHS